MLLEGGKLVQEEKGRLTVEKFQQFIDILTPSMDDYLYIYDLQGDCYCISPNALERFPLERSCFNEIGRAHV